MNAGPLTLTLEDVTNLELVQLQDELDEAKLPPRSASASKSPLRSQRRGEPGTLIVVLTVLGPPALAALSAWLAKGVLREKLTYECTTNFPDGTTQKVKLRASRKDVKEASEEILAQLMPLLNQSTASTPSEDAADQSATSEN